MNQTDLKPDRRIDILVVEDSPTQAAQLRHILEQAGYHAVLAPDGESAVARVRESAPDLVISDINMPGMDGYALCRHIKADPALAAIPVMLLTSLSDPVDVIRGLESGADSFTVKPYDRGPLLSRVANLLANRHLRDVDSACGGIEVVFDGRKFFVNSNRLQILNLLLSSYEAAVQKNTELADAKRRLEEWNERLEDGVQERTQALRAEVAERERVTEALRRNEHSLRIALHSVDLAMFHQDRNLRYTWVYHPQGGRPEDYLGHTDAEVLPAEVARPLTDLKREAIASGKRGAGQFVLHRDGEIRHFDVVIEPLHDAAEQIIGITGTSLDITRRVEAERATRAADALFRAVIEAAPDPIVIVGADGRIVSLNGAAEQAFGPRKALLVGTAVDEFIPHFMESSRLRARNVTPEGPIRARSAETLRLMGQRVDGSAFPVEISYAALEASPRAYVVAIVRDISERVALERQLQQTEKMNALGQLTGGIAHDFNNLLGVMLGNLDLIQSMTADEKMRSRIAAAQKAGERAADLTRRLLAFSRRQPLNLETTALNDSVRNLVEMASRTFGPNVKISTKLAPDLPPVNVDASEFESVLLNLAINSRDAMADGGEIVIATKALELDSSYAPVQAGDLTPGRYACVAVSDTGGGMPREVLERALEPFFTTKPRGQGTGFGLSMAYGFARQSNGHLALYSEVGHGTTVRIYLPLADQMVKIAAPCAAEPASVPDGASVLVVDDEPALLEIALCYLDEMGIRAVHATDGASALELLERDPTIVLLLTDVVMPGGLNGVELARRATGLRPGLKVTFTTGFPSTALSERSGLSLPGMVLNKPYRRSEFVDAIHRALKAAPTDQRTADRNEA